MADAIERLRIIARQAIPLHEATTLRTPTILGTLPERVTIPRNDLEALIHFARKGLEIPPKEPTDAH